MDNMRLVSAARDFENDVIKIISSALSDGETVEREKPLGNSMFRIDFFLEHGCTSDRLSGVYFTVESNSLFGKKGINTKWNKVKTMEFEEYKRYNIMHGLNLDTPIYKYLPLRYIPFLLQGKLIVGKVKEWEDVYENFLFKQEFTTPTGDITITAQNLIENNFGQSWTDADETDAMWRIYSDVSKCRNQKEPKGCLCSVLSSLRCNQEDTLANVAVRVRTTARKLFDTVYTDNQCMANTYIGYVQYMEQDEVTRWLVNLQPKVSDLQRKMAESLFIKRTEFSHEREVRIIMSFGSEDKRIKVSKIFYKMNPEDFIEEILIDPRLIGTEYGKAVKLRLVKEGAAESKIRMSKLYEFKPLPRPLVISWGDRHIKAENEEHCKQIETMMIELGLNFIWFYELKNLPKCLLYVFGKQNDKPEMKVK